MLQRPWVALKQVLIAAALVFSYGSALGDFDRAGTVRLATTTSTENSGLLNDLLPRFRAATGYAVHVIAVGTGKALRMGRDGDVDVVLVHAPAAEQRFVDEGYGEQRLPVMFNDFVIVGPPADPAGLQQATSASDALRRIAQTNGNFVSRGDDSGTHKKELTIWREAGVEPEGAWYREAGQGMGKVLQMADELDAYTLTDRGTWLAYRGKSRLRIAYQGHEELHNPYAIIAVSAARYPDLNHQGAVALIEWIRGPEGQHAIAAYRKSGEQLFTPSAGTLARR
ncbi:MAG: substrate-binding domain-containing protein [Sedimenticolaceae bacterium]